MPEALQSESTESRVPVASVQGQPAAEVSKSAKETGGSDKRWNWVGTCVMPVLMFVLTWLVKDRVVLEIEKQKVDLQGRQVKIMEDQSKQKPPSPGSSVFGFSAQTRSFSASTGGRQTVDQGENS